MTGKNEDAVNEYARAFQLDPQLVTAAYNAGVVEGRIGHLHEAAAWFERALKVDPKHADAAYNAGHTYYELKDYKKAAARWELAMKLEPDDFQIAKRLVQTYVAQNNKPQVKRARDRLFAMWRSNPENHKQKSYIYDVFPWGKYKVAVYEMFEPSIDPAIPMFEAHIELNDKLVGKVNLEQTKDGYLIGVVDKSGGHTTVLTSLWKKEPDYPTFRGAVGKTIDSKFQ
jgi:tetratricopeptide (TPR) repeat protein